MSIRFHWNNLTDSASAISANTEATGFPVENVQDDRVGKKYRTTGAGAAEYITIDLGAATTITAAAFVGHDFDNTETNIQLRKSNDNFVADNNLVSTFTYSAFTMIVWTTTAAERYWRIAFTKANAADIRNIGRVFLGTYFEPTRSQAAEWTRGIVDPSPVARALAGAVYADQREKYFRTRFSLNGLTAADIATARTMFAANGKTVPIFLTLDQGGAPNELTHYGRFDRVPDENEMLPKPNYRLEIEFSEEPG
jgi:hypothetical protein